ncbi:MAG: MFS transporter [Alphaproteobacteria bacterium]|nr:MFS transporter [Alphaproteobacteria bacterium]
MPLWLKALAATLVLQAVSSFLSRALPVVGPALTAAAGVRPEAVGYLAAFTAAGTVWCLSACAGTLPRLGALRLMQIGSLVGAAGLLLAMTGWWWAMLAAALLVGAGYAPSPPAGSDILARHAPRQHMSLVFSIKQSGVPLGGVVAGLMVPAIALALDWRWAMAAAAALALGCVVAMQPWRAAIDADRDPARPLGLSRLVSTAIVTGPWRSLFLAPVLPAITYVGFAFAIVQGCQLAFFVTFLDARGFGLAAAGSAFAVMQVAGTVARVATGWIADRLGSNRAMLLILAVASTLATLAIAAIGEGWSYLAVAAVAVVAGIASISWNGVYLAEVARSAPAGRIGDVTAGSTFFTFIGYVLGPAAFAEIVAWTGSYPTAFGLIAALPLTAGLALLAAARSAVPAAGSPPPPR